MAEDRWWWVDDWPPLCCSPGGIGECEADPDCESPPVWFAKDVLNGACETLCEAHLQAKRDAGERVDFEWDLFPWVRRQKAETA